VAGIEVTEVRLKEVIAIEIGDPGGIRTPDTQFRRLVL
jgi:hypothetical protein